MTDSDLVTFAANAIGSLTGNASYPALPVTLAKLENQQTTFGEKVVAAVNGNSAARAARDAARETLLASLRQIASYVQVVAGTNLEVLLTSGFVASSTNRSSAPLPTPTILTIDNAASRSLRVQVASVANAKAYELQFSTQPGVWVHGETYPSSRDLLLTNLTPGTTYAIQARVIGGSTGRSNWSDPVSHMAT